MSAQVRFALIALGGFLMTCTIGPAPAIVIDVIHPGIRATGAAVLALFSNLFGLLAALAFSFSARTYAAEMRRTDQATVEPVSTAVGGVRNGLT